MRAEPDVVQPLASADPSSLAAPRWARADVVLLAALGIAAFLFARWYVPAYRAAGGVPSFYQDQFAPAVMEACGRGFVNVDAAGSPQLLAFLYQRIDRLKCDDVPETLRLVPVNGFQATSRYLMAMVARVWRLTGVGWRALDVLMCAFFAVTVTAAYAAVRLGCGRTLSVAVVLLWVLSPRHLHNLPHLRDYSKAPFFVLMLIAMGAAFVERQPRRLIALGAIFGIVQGIGFGMRTDMMLNFIPFLIALCAAPVERLRHEWKPRVACAAVAIVAFAAASFPVIRAYASNGSLWHVSLLGLTAPHDENLNIDFPRTAYTFPYAHNDNYIVAVIQAYWSRVHPEKPPVVMLTPAYDEACRHYFATVARNFPADIGARMLSAGIHVANLPFLMDGRVALGITGGPLAWISEHRSRLLERFNGIGPLLLAGVLVVVGISRLSYVVVSALLLGNFLTYPFLEFQGRHIFHLEFLMLAVFASGGSLLVRLVRARGGEMSAAPIGTRAVRSAAAVGLLFASIVIALFAARAIQAPRARTLIMSYLNAPTTPLRPTPVAMANDRLRLGVDLFRPRAGRNDVQEVMIRADFTPERCAPTAALVPVTFRYENGDPRFGLNPSRDIELELFGPGTSTRAFLPVYSVWRDWNLMTRFVGVDVPRTLADCVQLSVVDDVSRLPLVLPVTVAPNWNVKLYQRLRLVPQPFS